MKKTGSDESLPAFGIFYKKVFSCRKESFYKKDYVYYILT